MKNYLCSAVMIGPGVTLRGLLAARPDLLVGVDLASRSVLLFLGLLNSSLSLKALPLFDPLPAKTGEALDCSRSLGCLFLVSKGEEQFSLLSVSLFLFLSKGDSTCGV